MPATTHPDSTSPKRKKLSTLLTLLATFSLGLLATGCSLGAQQAKTPQKIQVRIWRIGQDSDTLRSIITDFQKQNKNVVVTYHKKSATDYEIAALKSMASRQGPDIVSIPNDWLGDFEQVTIPLPDNFFCSSSSNTCQKPADAVKTLFPPGIADAITRTDGKVYGMPTNVDSLQLYYNPDLFDQAVTDYRTSLGPNYSDTQYEPVRQLLSRPPATWTDLVDQTKYLTQRSGSTLTRGAIALGTADNAPNANDILELMMLQNGAKIVSSDHKNVLFHIQESTPSGGVIRPGEEALAFFTSFADPTKANYSWNPSMPDALDAFAQGKVAMVIAYSDFGEQLKIKYPRFHPQVAPVPQISPVQPAVNFVRFSVETVTQTADSPAAAFAFLQQYVGYNTSDTLAKEQGLQSPYTARLNSNSGNIQNNQILSGQTTFKLHHTEFDAVFHQMIVDVSQNGIPVDQALDAGAERANELLAATDQP